VEARSDRSFVGSAPLLATAALSLLLTASARATSLVEECLASPTTEHCCRPGQKLRLGTPAGELFLPFPHPALCVFAAGGDDGVVLGSAGFAAGGPGHDVVVGGPGADLILGQEGNDRLLAGAGNDVVVGGAGHDVLLGGPGNDRLEGNAGNDWLDGGPGSDRIVPGAGADVVFGGAGPDEVVVNDLCEVPGHEWLSGGPGADALSLPVPPDQAAAAGLHFTSFEHFTVEPRACHAECVEPPDCSGRGQCAEGAAPGEVTCACDPGWAGESCEWCIGGAGFACPSFDVDVASSPSGTELVALETAPARSLVAPGAPAPAPPTLGTGVSAAIDAAAPDDLLAVSLSVRSATRAPTLPRLRTDLDRSDPVNLALGQLRQTVHASFEATRFAEMSWVVDAIEDAGGAVHTQQALGSVVVADVPSATLEALASDVRVARIVLLDTGFEPPSIDIGACGDVGTVVGCGSADEEAASDACTPVSITEHAATLRLNQLRQAGFGASGYVVGVLDTGAAEHDMLEGQVVAHHACNTVEPECQDEDPFDSADGTGHGTATHSIIAGNTALGNLDRGITLARTESWRVYDVVSNGGPKGIAGALAAGNEVLLLEVQTIGGGTTNMEGPAEEAFDAGAVVVGVTGNAHDHAPCALEMGPLAQVPNVITTGAYALFEGDFVPFARQQVGNVGAWGVIKPDVVMPSFARGASKECSDCLDENGFSSSSGAGPFAAAMAVQILDRVASLAPENTNARDLAGVVHAAMVAFGTNEIDAVSDDRLDLEGAGRAFLRRPACSRWKFGKVVVDAGDTVTVDVTPSVLGVSGAHAAIWWPQAMGGPHNRVALELVDESNDAIFETDHPTSVFQNVLRESATGADWRLEITNHGASDQEVFYFFRHGFPDAACSI
jgi:hypothetical protein